MSKEKIDSPGARCLQIRCVRQACQNLNPKRQMYRAQAEDGTVFLSHCTSHYLHCICQRGENVFIKQKPWQKTLRFRSKIEFHFKGRPWMTKCGNSLKIEPNMFDCFIGRMNFIKRLELSRWKPSSLCCGKLLMPNLKICPADLAVQFTHYMPIKTVFINVN